MQESIRLDKIHVYRGGRDSTIFFSKPNKIGIEISDTGTDFVRPFGTVEVQNIFGKQIGTYQLNNPQQPGNILPGTTRVFTHDYSTFPRFGRYVVSANVSFGDGKQVLSIKKVIWYIPAWLAIATAVVILVIIFLVWRAWRGHKRRRHYHYHNR